MSNYERKYDCATTELWPHQRAAVDAAHRALADGHAAGLWVMPTGSGKTRAFCALARELALPTLVVVHRDELLHQAVRAFWEVWPGAKVVPLGSEGSGPADVVVATVQTLSKRLHQFTEGQFGLVVVDEAHHAPAASWQGVINHFRPRLLLGCTATPERHDGEPLQPLFGGRVLHEYTQEQAIEDGHLVPLRQRAVFTSASLDGVRRSRGDLSVKALAPVVVTEERTRAVVEGYLEHGAGRPALFFAVNLGHVDQLCAALGQRGVQARAITGEMTAKERRPWLEAFRRGEVRALVSCAVLTEGYDEPSVSCVVMARPTLSRSLYQQCVGRGLRADRGQSKQDCLVLDVIDRGRKHDVVYASRLFGGRARDCEGQDVREAVRREREGWELRPLVPTAAQLARWDNGEDAEWPELPTLEGYVPSGQDRWPARERQLRRLRDFGLGPARDLTGGQADYLLAQCEVLDRQYPTEPTPGLKWALQQEGLYREGMTKRQALRLVRWVKANQA